MAEKLDLGGLVPNFADFSFPLDSAEDVSVFFICLLVSLGFAFLLQLLWATYCANHRTSWLLKLIATVDEETVATHQGDLRDSARENKKREGHLWTEFDESLIEVKRGDAARLYNTLDADHFFNERTIAPEATNSRMLAAVPGFLTAVGVIGTFTGLQLGLSELNIGNDVAVADMKAGLAHVISGAKIAFMTSVWGVFLSFLFSLFEKFLTGLNRTKISKLQRKIDELFPRINAEYQLQQIANDGRESRESLQGLAEKIGEKMQESLEVVSSGIQHSLESSLEKIMAPAINKLVNETTDGNQKALESLLEAFMARFGEQGHEQRQAMEQASKNVNDALGALSSSMATFLEKLEQSQGKSAEREKDLIESISHQVAQLVTSSEDHGKKLSEYVENQLERLSENVQARERAALERDQRRQDVFIQQTNAIKASTDEIVRSSQQQINKLSNSLDERDKLLAEREQERQEAFIQQVTEVKAGTEALLKRVENSVAIQAQASRRIIEQGEKLQEGITKSVLANTEASVEMKRCAEELKASSQSMQTFGAQIQKAGNTLADAVSEAAESTNELARSNQQFKGLIDQQKQLLISGQEQFNDAITQLNTLMSLADGSFDKMKEHQESFLQGQADNVANLARQMTDLLQDYAEKANSQTAEHLGIWAKHSYDYAEKMNSAANALSTVVDEIDGKLKN